MFFKLELRQIPTCQQCTNEAKFCFIVGLVVLFDFFSWFHITHYKIDLIPDPWHQVLLLPQAISKWSPLLSPTLVMAILCIPFSLHSFSQAMACLLRPHYFPASGGQHVHLVDKLLTTRTVARLENWAAYIRWMVLFVVWYICNSRRLYFVDAMLWKGLGLRTDLV